MSHFKRFQFDMLVYFFIDLLVDNVHNLLLLLTRLTHLMQKS